MNVNLSKDSWHYRLAQFHQGYGKSCYAPEDICSYTRAVFVGLMLLSMGIVAVASMVLCVLELFFLDYLSPFGAAGFLLLASILLVLASGAFGFTVMTVKNYVESRLEPSDGPTFVSSAWATMRDRMCLRITWKNGR